jgi:sugar phosphate permease
MHGHNRYWLNCVISNHISCFVSHLFAYQHRALNGNRRAMSTVAALIDGPPSLAAALGQIGVPYVADAIGWSFVFYLFIAMVCWRGRL